MEKNNVYRWGKNTYWLVAMLFVLAKLVLHFTTNTRYELHRDEMLYFNMGEHLSFGYATVPPVTGFLAYVVKSIFGYSVFGIRLIPALLGASSLLVMAKINKLLGGGIPALVLASIAFLLAPGFLLFNSLFSPNMVEQFLWLTIMYLFLKMILQNNPRIWLGIGVLAGVSFMTKYSVVFLTGMLMLAILTSHHRKLLVSRYLVIAVLAGFIIILPNILWQYLHNWPVVNHISELKKTQMDNMKPIHFLFELFSLHLASSIIWLVGLFALLFINREKNIRFLGLASLLIILFFLLSKGKAYYTLGLIPFLFAMGGNVMEKYLNGKWKLVNYAVLVVSVFFSLVALPFNLPVMSFDALRRYDEATNHWIVYPFSRWEDGKIHSISQVYTDMTGWRQLAGCVAKAYHQLPDEEKEKCTIYAERNYGYASAIHFYGKKYGLPDAVTFLESYVIWAPDTIPEGPIIYINYKINEMDKLFGKVTEICTIEDRYFRENGLKVFLCTQPGKEMQEVYRLKAKEEKRLYGL